MGSTLDLYMLVVLRAVMYSAPEGIIVRGQLDATAAALSSSAQPEDEGSVSGESAWARAGSYGQALQYLDRTLAVAPGDKVTLVAKRDGAEVRRFLFLLV